MLKYQNVHRNILIYIYINMYKYSYNMQNGYADMLNDKVYGVLSVGIYTLLHPSCVGL